MATTEVDAPKNHVLHSPLLRFRKRANCNLCPLCDACQRDKSLETRCILALIADNLHTLRLNAIRGTHQ